MLKRRDFVFLFLLCIVGVILTLIIYIPKPANGVFLEVRVDGKLTAVYPLQDDTTVVLGTKPAAGDMDTKHSEHYNLLQIQNGVASIIEANCRDQLCMYQKSISSVGESIVCLPHRLSVTVTGKDENTPDAIAS